jgi:hypothetical protein
MDSSFNLYKKKEEEGSQDDWENSGYTIDEDWRKWCVHALSKKWKKII